MPGAVTSLKRRPEARASGAAFVPELIGLGANEARREATTTRSNAEPISGELVEQVGFVVEGFRTAPALQMK